MTERKTAGRLDFEALRLGIERCDPDLILDFYAEDADLSIVNAEAQRSSPFELCGRAEIAKHLRATFGPESSHRVEREVVGEDRVTFWEECEYLDGSRLWVETTLEVRDGKIIRQVDVLATDERTGRKEVGGQTQRLKQATEKEDSR
jgi:SnoaL-like domain